MSRERGKVKWFDAKVKAYGFITHDDGREVFVHISNVQNKEALDEGQPVEFDIKKTQKGDSAINVRKCV